MGTKSTYFENKVLAAAGNAGSYTGVGTVYSALFTVIPSASTAGTEVTNATSGYTRVATTFCTAGVTAAGQMVNTAILSFATLLAAVTVVGWALCDTSTVGAGNELYWATVTTIAFGIGDQPVVAVGGVVITEA